MNQSAKGRAGPLLEANLAAVLVAQGGQALDRDAVEGRDYELESLVRELNLASAKVAREAVD